jgi:hypothetical protein
MILADNGIFITPEVLEKTREERTSRNGTVLAFTMLRMKYTFWADDGSSVCCIVEGEGMDSGDKSSNKAMSVAQKYALLQVFCIPTAEPKDPDADSHTVTSRQGHKPETDTRINYKRIAALLHDAQTEIDINAILVAEATAIASLPKAGRDGLEQIAEMRIAEFNAEVK